MWTSTFDFSPARVISARLVGYFWHGIYFSAFAPMQVQNLPRQPLPAPNWVRVRNQFAGISQSDLQLFYANPKRHRKQPFLGHEVVGEVVEIGNAVQHLQVGDRVAFQHDRNNCLSDGMHAPCRLCASGNMCLCERAREQSLLTDPRRVGSGWSEEMLLHEQQLFRIPSAISNEQAVLLEPSAIAVHAVLRHVPQPGSRILIAGADTIGLLILQIVHALVPQTVVSVLAYDAAQAEQAMHMGATQIIYPEELRLIQQRGIRSPMSSLAMNSQISLDGYDLIYTTVGNKHLLRRIVDVAHATATIVLVDLDLRHMSIDLNPIVRREINIVSSSGHGLDTWPIGTAGTSSSFTIAAEMISKGHLSPEQLITHRFAPSDYRQAITMAKGGAYSRTMKVILDYSLLPASIVPNVQPVRKGYPRHAAVAYTRPPRVGVSVPLFAGSSNSYPLEYATLGSLSTAHTPVVSTLTPPPLTLQDELPTTPTSHDSKCHDNAPWPTPIENDSQEEPEDEGDNDRTISFTMSASQRAELRHNFAKVEEHAIQQESSTQVEEPVLCVNEDAEEPQLTVTEQLGTPSEDLLPSDSQEDESQGSGSKTIIEAKPKPKKSKSKTKQLQRSNKNRHGKVSKSS